jgi:hypothetical protein
LSSSVQILSADRFAANRTASRLTANAERPYAKS